MKNYPEINRLYPNINLEIPDIRVIGIPRISGIKKDEFIRGFVRGIEYHFNYRVKRFKICDSTGNTFLVLKDNRLHQELVKKNNWCAIRIS